MARRQPLQSRVHGLVPQVVLREQGAVGADALPDGLDALRLARLEPADGLDDRAREAHPVHAAGTHAARVHHRAREDVAVEGLDRLEQPGVVDPLDVDDLGFHGRLQVAGERVDGLHGVLAVGVGIGVQRQPRAERDEHTRAKRLARLEGEAHGHHGQRARMRGLPRQRDARGACLELLHARLRVRGPLRIDGDQRAVPEGGRARGEGLRVLVGRGVRSLVLLSPHGDGAGRAEEARDERVLEEGGGGEVVHLAPHGSADDERVDEVVGVVDAEEHRPLMGHALRTAHVDRLEEEPQPEPRDRAHGPVEAVHALRRAHAV